MKWPAKKYNNLRIRKYVAHGFNLALMHWSSLTLAEFQLPQHIFNSHYPICYWKESYYLLVSTSEMQSLTENSP